MENFTKYFPYSGLPLHCLLCTCSTTEYILQKYVIIKCPHCWKLCKYFPHIKVSTFRFAGNSTKPSTICQNSSTIILAVLTLCIEHVLVLAGCEVVRGPGATRLVFSRVIFWVIWIFITSLWHFISSLPPRFPIHETILHKFEQFYFHYSNKCFTIIQDKSLLRFLGRSYFELYNIYGRFFTASSVHL